MIFVLLAGLSWGVYVPLIAQGGKELKSSYASFLCVGAAYFVIAVLLPLGMLWYHERPAELTTPRTFLPPVITRPPSPSPPSPARPGPSARLCVIFATFEFKGPRIYVAPVIFALAPGHQHHRHPLLAADVRPAVVFGPPTAPPHWSLYVGIVLAGLGAGLVLFAKELGEAKHAAHLKPATGHAPTGPAVASEAIKP